MNGLKENRLDKLFSFTYCSVFIVSGNKAELVQFVKERKKIEVGYLAGERASDIDAAWHNQLTSIGVLFVSHMKAS